MNLIIMDEKVKHLELIQGVINRLAQVSFILKGWAVTLVVGLLVVVANTPHWWYGFMGLIPIFVFWGLDAFYLRQERLFRLLYEKARTGSNGSGIPIFSMDTSGLQSNTDNWGKTLFSLTLLGVYGMLGLLVVIASLMMILTRCH